MLALSASAPVVRVIVSSGTGWLVAAVAVLGLVLAVVSLAWQVVMFTRSGSRVRVEAKFGTFPSELLPGRVPTTAPPIFLSDEILAAMRPQGYPGVKLIAVIRNVGRQAVTVQRCQWDTGHEQFGVMEDTLGTPFEHRLEPDAQCLSVIDLATALAVVGAPLRDKSFGRQVWPVVELGHGRPKKGKPVEIPARSEDQTISAHG